MTRYEDLMTELRKAVKSRNGDYGQRLLCGRAAEAIEAVVSALSSLVEEVGNLPENGSGAIQGQELNAAYRNACDVLDVRSSSKQDTEASDIRGGDLGSIPSERDPLEAYIDDYEPGCAMHRLFVELRERRQQKLTPTEDVALLVAWAQVSRYEYPQPGVATVCVAALQRLHGREDLKNSAGLAHKSGVEGG